MLCVAGMAPQECLEAGPFVALFCFSCDSRRTTGSAPIRRTCSWIAAASGASSGRKSTVSHGMQSDPGSQNLSQRARKHKKYFSAELDPAHSRRLPRSLRAPQIYRFYPDTVDFGLNAASRLGADTPPVTRAYAVEFKSNGVLLTLLLTYYM